MEKLEVEVDVNQRTLEINNPKSESYPKFNLNKHFKGAAAMNSYEPERTELRLFYSPDNESKNTPLNEDEERLIRFLIDKGLVGGDNPLLLLGSNLFPPYQDSYIQVSSKQMKVKVKKD